MVSMKHDMKNLKIQLQAMHEVLRVTEEELVEFYRVGASYSENFSEMGKKYQKTIDEFKTSSSFMTSPAFDSKPLFEFMQKLVLLLEGFRKFYSVESLPQYVAISISITQATKLCKTQISEILNKHILEVLTIYEKYKNYQNLQKEVLAERRAEDNSQNDPIINYAISLQEKTKEKIGILIQRKREISLILRECETELNSRIFHCNQEVEQCEELFKRTFAKLLETLASSTRLTFNTEKISEQKISLLNLAKDLSTLIPKKSIKLFHDSLITQNPQLHFNKIKVL